MCAYNNSFISELGVCREALMPKDKSKPYRFFVVPREGPGLQGMPDVETLELLGVNCNTIESSQKSRKINEQAMEDMSCINKDLKDMEASVTLIDLKHK